MTKSRRSTFSRSRCGRSSRRTGCGDYANLAPDLITELSAVPTDSSLRIAAIVDELGVAVSIVPALFAPTLPTRASPRLDDLE